MPLAKGQVLNNRYRIVNLLGQGGFGAVYKVWDINLERPCALKENLDASPEAIRQFEREARILANLSHPNLPRVIDYFAIVGQGQYLVMEFVEGYDLQQMLESKGRPLSERQVLPWIMQICDALDYLHSQKPAIVHRDIKPANIKVTSDGRAMLVDFGIAKVYDPQLRTTIGARAVTPGYSPNEQYISSGRTDGRTDIYALGATLYTILTGMEPPEAPERNMGKKLPSPRILNASISPHIDAAIIKAMEMLPEKRYQSIPAFKAALQIPTTVVRSKSTSVLTPMQAAVKPKPVSRLLPWGLFALFSVMAIVIVILLFIAFGWGNGPLETREVTQPIVLVATSEVIEPTSSSIKTPLQTLSPTETLTPTSLPTATSYSLTDVTANITIPQNRSGVPQEVNISGTIQGLGPGQRAFLCIQSTAYGKYIYPQGEIFPDAQGNWTVLGIYRSVNFDYRTFVVVTDNNFSAEILADQNSRSNGFPDLPENTVIISPVIVVTRT